jgi:N-acyl-D-amino-acid deacylase
MNYDLVIKKTLIYDGTGSAAFPGSVAISAGKIAAVDGAILHDKREIDADGLALAPGFIDIHTHFDAEISWDPLFTPHAGMGSPPC